MVRHNIVVEVSRYGGHWNAAGGDLKVRQRGETRGQNRQLYAAGNLEFLLNFAELLVALQSSSRSDVSQRTQEHYEPEGL